MPLNVANSFARMPSSWPVPARTSNTVTKANHLWTNVQVERINRTIKDATVRRYHYEDHPRLREHLAIFLNAYNFGKRLKTLRGLTPHERICQVWDRYPSGSIAIHATTPRDCTSSYAYPEE